jgi:hypothetical protein
MGAAGLIRSHVAAILIVDGQEVLAINGRLRDS